MDTPIDNSKRDLVYKNTPQRDLLLTFLPPTEEKYEYAPVYFVIPGGGWHSEKREDMLDMTKEAVEILRKNGFAVISIDYRTCREENIVMRDILCDCFDAARYAAHFDKVLKIDRHKFIPGGHSAGGHLALMLACAPQKEFYDGYEFQDEFGISAAAVQSPVTVLYDNSTHNLRDLSEVFGDNFNESELRQTSPISYISKDTPPTLLCAGTCDYLVFPISSQQFYNKLKENGVDCKIIYSHGGGHCFEQIIDGIEPSISKEEMQKLIAEFIMTKVR